MSKTAVLVCAILSLGTAWRVLWSFDFRDDYKIYLYFAEAACAGHNPYAVPAEWKSTVARAIYKEGFFKDDPSQVLQQYADYPPGLMAVNALTVCFGGRLGLHWLYVMLYACSMLVACRWCWRGGTERLPFLVMLAASPLVVNLWFHPAEDKIWFVLLHLLCLATHEKPVWFGLAAGLFAGLKGVGVLLMAFWLVARSCGRGRRWAECAQALVPFIAIMMLSHVPYFPYWIRGYEFRAMRQLSCGHASLWRLLYELGYYKTWMPMTASLVMFAVLFWITAKKRLGPAEMLGWVATASILFQPEAGFDRLLVPLLILVSCCPSEKVAWAIVLGSFALGGQISFWQFAYDWRWALGWFTIWNMFLVLGLTAFTVHRTGSIQEKIP